MGEWKAPLSLRVRQELRREMEAVAEKERRTLGNLGVLLLEWAFEQSTERVLTYKIKPKLKEGS